MPRTSWILAAALVTMSGAGHAQGFKPVTVVRTLPGYRCMALASTYGAQGTYAPPAPVYAGPQASAVQIGTGAGTIIASASEQPTNGRLEIVRPNGQKAWMDVNQLTVWHSLSDPSAVCRPVLLSNGRYGTDAGH